jgi:NAD+ dependent glucose-6-phosphate dehydrogenase
MRVVITGAAGQIGKEMVEELSDTHEICPIDRVPIPDRPSIIADLSQPKHAKGWRTLLKRARPRWVESFKGADVVLHLAGDVRNYALWESVLRDNIEATWNVFECAVQQGVRRVVFASSNWAVKALEHKWAPACYMGDRPKIGSDAPLFPLRPYGASKAFGELAGQMFVNQRQLDSFVAVRIGAYGLMASENDEYRRLWIGIPDMRSLLRRCIEEKFTGFHVVYGVSAQPEAPYDLSHTRRLLSWEPKQLP